MLTVLVVSLLGLLIAASAGARAQPRYRFEDLAVTVQLYHGKPTNGFVTYYRLNRALPYAPRGKYETEEEGGPRAYAAYIAVDSVYEEGEARIMEHSHNSLCYVEEVEILPGYLVPRPPALHPHEHQPHVGEVVKASLVIHGHRVLTVRTRVKLRKEGPRFRKRDGSLLSLPDLPYEKAFGCL